MEPPPHPMRLGDDEEDYYRGTYRNKQRVEDPAEQAPEFDLKESALRDLAAGEEAAS
jgi:hypothetical protein